MRSQVNQKFYYSFTPLFHAYMVGVHFIFLFNVFVEKKNYVRQKNSTLF
jgi:hypothetical protein